MFTPIHAIILWLLLVSFFTLLGYIVYHYRKIDARYILYVGWIPASWGYTRNELKEMGVMGAIALIDWAGGQAFEYCEASRETMDFLVSKGLPNPGSFTAIDIRTGQQLPFKQQKLWRYGQ